MTPVRALTPNRYCIYCNCWHDRLDQHCCAPKRAIEQATAIGVLREALESVLAHVENTDQMWLDSRPCTLCLTYRNIIRAALEKTEKFA